MMAVVHAKSKERKQQQQQQVVLFGFKSVITRRSMFYSVDLTLSQVLAEIMSRKASRPDRAVLLTIAAAFRLQS